MRGAALALLGVVLGATTAQASGDALVIGNSRYSAVQTLFGAQRVGAAAQALYERGFDVALAQDASAEEMRRAFGEFGELLDDDGGPVVIVLTGAFVHSDTGSYLLPVDGAGQVDEIDVLLNGFPLDAALTVLAAYQGRAFLILGETATEPALGSFLSPGLGVLDIPQGVTVLRGPAVDVARYAVRDMARTGRFVRRAAIEYELTVEGYAPPTQVIVRAEDVAPPAGAAEPPLPDPVASRASDDAAWRLAQQADSADGYRTYLDGFPDGAHVNAARQRLSALDSEPFYAERRAEEALELDRDQRRAIQRALTILGFDTRGIDGVFGNGTRGAIRNWQEAAGLPVSSYLSNDQIARLQVQAARRAAELEDEARRKQEARDREELEFWRRVESRGDEAGFRDYLKTYPDGRFAAEAKAVLKRIDDQRADQAAGQDRRDWAQAAQTNTVGAYRDYLEKWPTGAFRAEADQRIAELQQDAEKVRNALAARDEEQAMNLNFVARQLAEHRLDQLGLNPGKVDGIFDANTRTALRKYQESRGLRVSGYMDEQTVVRLLADSIRGGN
ncbi:peptidoglycan-binding domain-containing protein [Maliponia aquimaris]|uniref:Putative peptidoglycan binding domain protein n=1 Tax=Maliponia aquimaris TaxID=1673631 RepID=A0A238K8P7_9RHOB|nr:peptidoglycan-binding protein [Maliponia aquimaris]SMX38336.1 Putative peptidoglycan binding domain protein [Maliponia aquimaris]